MSVLTKTGLAGVILAASTFAAAADCEAVGYNGQSRGVASLQKSSRTGEICVQKAQHWAAQGGKMSEFMNQAGSGTITVNCKDGRGRQVVGFFEGTSVSAVMEPGGC